MRRGVVVVLAVMAMTAFADAASGATFQPGDLLLQRDLYDPEETRWLRANGSFVERLHR